MILGILSISFELIGLLLVFTEKSYEWFGVRRIDYGVGCCVIGVCLIPFVD